MEISTAMWDMVLSVVIGAAAVGVLAAVWVAVWVFRENTLHDRQWVIVWGFVNAAEQMLAGQDGVAKLDWVMAQLKERFPRLDVNLIRAMVETAVRQMKSAKPTGG